MTGRRAAFLDRDGVLNERPPAHEYVTDPRALKMLPGVGAAIARLQRAGWLVIVVSNQRGVARGKMSLADLADVEARMRELLDRDGAQVTGFYYCPHDGDAGCDCRKPAPGLILRAAQEHGVDLAASALIGDSETDIEAGRAAGLPLLIRIGAGPTAAHASVPDLEAAAALILAQPPRARSISSS